MMFDSDDHNIDDEVDCDYDDEHVDFIIIFNICDICDDTID